MHRCFAQQGKPLLSSINSSAQPERSHDQKSAFGGGGGFKFVIPSKWSRVAMSSLQEKPSDVLESSPNLSASEQLIDIHSIQS